MSLTLAAADTITGVAGSATAITYTIFGDEISAGADAFKVLAQGQLPSSVGTLYTVPGSTMAIVKNIHLVNGTGGSVTARLNVKGTAAANAILPAITILASGFAIFGDDGWKVYNDQGQLLSAGATGATGSAGTGIPVGGATAQRLAKIDATDYNTEWVTPADAISEITTIPTAEMDDTLVLAPDGAGGVEFRAEAGGGGGAPGGPNDDEGTATWSSTSGGNGWSALGSLDAADSNTKALDHIWVRAPLDSSGSNYYGLYKACPTIPFTMTARLTDVVHDPGGYTRFGIAVSTATASSASMCYIGSLWNGSAFQLEAAGLSTLNVTAPPVLLRLVVHSSSSVDVYYSFGGALWTLVGNTNPGFTVGSVVLFVRQQNTSTKGEGAWDWIRFT
jgi:hypothetical protein